MRKATKKERSAGLRTRAEQRVGAGEPVGPGVAEAEPMRLLHELRVHQVELEMQNEELRHARGETEAALEQFAELFEFAPVGYVALTAAEEISAINHAASQLLGLEVSRAVGHAFSSFVELGDRTAWSALVGEAIDRRVSVSARLTLRTRARAGMVATVTLSYLARGERKFLLAFEDVTEQSEREARLVRAEEDLREADRRKDEFLAMLSHELRNPLAPIRNSLYLLGRTAGSTAAAQKAHAVIDRQIGQMTRLIDDLLDVTRIRKGRSELRREHVELVGLVRGAIEDHRSSFESAGIDLSVELPAGSLWAFGDPARLAQVLSNLLGNAKKFTLPGGVVTVSLEPDGDHATLRVRDTGIGIEPHEVERIFEPFSQGSQKLDRTRGGLGLGLSMVKGFVELHGGTVVVESGGLGQGTAAIVRLPLERAPVAAPRPGDAKPSRPRRVLVIDDNVDCADMLKEALALSLHDARVAYDGRAGLVLARGFRPEIVICDIGLPEMDGYEVARAFRADDALKSVYLIALTGYARLEDRRRSALAGFNQHVAKPPNMEILERLLSEAPSLTA